MLIHVSKRSDTVQRLDGDVQVLISIGTDGRFTLTGYRFGEWNTTYARTDAAVIELIPGLIAELQAEVAAHQGVVNV